MLTSAILSLKSDVDIRNKAIKKIGKQKLDKGNWMSTSAIKKPKLDVNICNIVEYM